MIRKKTTTPLPSAYPTGSIFQGGLNLREVAVDRSGFVAPLQPLRSNAAPDVIVIPTSTNARKNHRNIEHIFLLAASQANNLILFLCSGKAKKEDIAEIAKPYSVQWAAIDEGFSSWSKSSLHTSLSPLAYGKEKDTSQKRNFALRLAQVMGWHTIFFMDDDIQLNNEQFQKAMALIREEDVSVVGFNARNFPDLSVINHAHRWIDGPIDSFLGAGALLIKIGPTIGFFPHIYNEDWFFLLEDFLSNRGRIIWAGSIEQDRYNPYKVRKRAIQEEPGDVLGEGLMRLAIATNMENKFGRPTITSVVKKADAVFWEHEIDRRIQYIQNTILAIRDKRMPSKQKYTALNALEVSLQLLIAKDTSITAKNLTEWTKAWGKDLRLWRRQIYTGAQATNLIDGLKILNIYDNFIYSSGGKENAFIRPPKYAALFQKTRVADTVASVNIEANKKVMGAVEYTIVTERYLTANKWTLSHIVNATERLRLDRPIYDKAVNYPVLTILLLVDSREQPSQISEFIRKIVKKNRFNRPIEIILAVRAQNNRLHATMYRNELVAHIVHEISGTNIRLRSTIIHTRKNTTTDDAIQSLLTTMVFAYWKANISITQPVLVTNSRGQLMRTGTLRELMQKQHSVVWTTFDTHLAELLHPAETTNHVLSPEDDIVAKEQARRNLYTEPRRKKLPLKIRWITQKMTLAMKMAGLTWSQTDALAHKIKFHDIHRKTTPLFGIMRSKCIAIYITPQTLTNYNAQAKAILMLITNSKTNYCLVISASTDITWRQLETYRKRLAAAIVAEGPNGSISSLTYRRHNEERGIVFKKRVVAIVRYTHWLHQHHQSATITWLHLTQPNRSLISIPLRFKIRKSPTSEAIF